MSSMKLMTCNALSRFFTLVIGGMSIAEPGSMDSGTFFDQYSRGQLSDAVLGLAFIGVG